MVERIPLGGKEIDYFMLVAALGIALIMVMSVPVNHHPFRSAIFCIILKKDDFSKKENILATAIFSALTCTVAVLFPNITSVL